MSTPPLVLKLAFAELPEIIRENYNNASLQPDALKALREKGAIVSISAIAVVDTHESAIYTTRDNGLTFEVGKIITMKQLQPERCASKRIFVRCVLDLKDIQVGR